MILVPVVNAGTFTSLGKLWNKWRNKSSAQLVLWLLSNTPNRSPETYTKGLTNLPSKRILKAIER